MTSSTNELFDNNTGFSVKIRLGWKSQTLTNSQASHSKVQITKSYNVEKLEKESGAVFTALHFIRNLGISHIS